MTPEFALAAACCRWPPSPERDALIVSTAANTNWPLFAAVARRHRIEGLVWSALRHSGIELPTSEAEQLRDEAEKILRNNLTTACEARRLMAAFALRDVPVLFVKGLTLAKLSYGGIALKKGWDIDILVAPEALSEAIELLIELSYEVRIPASASMLSLQAWHMESKESVWSNSANGLFVELHTRLVDSPYLLPGVGIRSGAVNVEVAQGIVLPTLPPDELFAYLCVHGASSAWFRLKWLADFAALAHSDPEELLRLYHRAVELGAGRAVAQALLLSADLLGTNLPTALESALRASWSNRTLVAAAKRLMDGGVPAKELQKRLLGTWAIHWTQLLLVSSWSYVFRELQRQWRAVWLSGAL